MEEKLKSLVQRVSKKKYVEAIILFGSRAKGRARKDSDYDLAVLTKQITSAQAYDTIGLGSDSFQIELFNKLPLLIRYDVIKYGKILYCKDKNALNEIFFHTLKQYLDFEPRIKLFYKAVINGIQH